MTSNPFFAFHDDVFPAFAKNAASQPRFPRPSFYHNTIIPDNYFSSLEELKHISTIELRLNGTEKFQFEIDFEEQLRASRSTKILELRFFDEKSLMNFGIFENSSIWMDSAYFDETFVFNSDVSQLKQCVLYLKSNQSIGSVTLEVVEEFFEIHAFKIILMV